MTVKADDKRKVEEMAVRRKEELAEQIRQHELPEIDRGLSKGWLVLVLFLILLFILPWILLILYRCKKNKTMRVMAAQKEAKEQ